MRREQPSALINQVEIKSLFVFIIGDESVEFFEQIPATLFFTLNCSILSTLLVVLIRDPFIQCMAAEERNHRSSGTTEVSVFDELQTHPDKVPPSVMQYHLAYSFH